MSEADYQTRPGLTKPCCLEMQWAVSAGYIRRGYLYRKFNPPKWVPWSFNIPFPGGTEQGPIRFCPWSGHDLDESEE